ncbi:hypothetical protein HPT27_09105 [Permianibacter sp. IMCC34836]|uniref:hypothetical protein n=1 Tax=Permianibacter fluminis TaxID=2738515 RepID=UPI001557B5A3|nr:hypothetical protein [Permianibacter fluminis]NQD37183.1 hypothetical protein [Permianibacter fluminis]
MKQLCLALVVAALLPLLARADDLSYSYIQAGYASSELDDLTFDGASVQGSVAFGTSNFYAVVNHESGSDGDFDMTQTSAGVGYHFDLSANADVFTELAYIANEVEYTGSSGYTSDDNGYRVTAGLRGMFSSSFEAILAVHYTDVNDFGSGYGGTLGAVIHFSPRWSLYGSYTSATRDDVFDDGNMDLKTTAAGVRFSF